MTKPLGTTFFFSCLPGRLAPSPCRISAAPTRPRLRRLRWRPLAAHAPEPAAVIAKYCVTCHNQKRKVAGLAIDTLDLQRVADDAEAWEKIARKFRTHEMPPPGAPRPDKATYATLNAHIENALDAAAAGTDTAAAFRYIVSTAPNTPTRFAISSAWRSTPARC